MPLISGGARHSRSGGRTTTAAASTENDARDALALPPYEPLTCSLSEEAKRALHGLAHSRDTRRCEDHIKRSMTHLGKNVLAINDRLNERRDELKQLVQKRASKGPDAPPSRREERVAEAVSRLEREADTLSRAQERGLRNLVDWQVELQDDRDAAGAVAAYFEALPARPAAGGPGHQSRRRTRRRRGENQGGGREEQAEEGREAEDQDQSEDEEEEEGAEVDALPPPDRDPFDLLREQRAAKASKYQAMTYYQRYALNNDYAAFKKLWHDATFGEADVPLPDPSRWFDDRGNPVEAAQPGSGGGDNYEEEEEDFVIEGEHQSFQCPLSMAPITQPYSNHKCPHTFQMPDMKAWLRSQGRAVECPVSGCSVVFGLGDFYFDELVLRKIERARKRKEREEAEEEGRGEEEENDDDDDGRPPKKRAASSGIKREGSKRTVEQIDDNE